MICSCQIDSGHIIVFPGGIFLFLVFWAFLAFGILRFDVPVFTA
jgi:hypothetical protein